MRVNKNADAVYSGYIDNNLDAICLSYIKSQSESLYAQVTAQAVYEQLIEKGYTSEQVAAFIQTDEGKMMLSQAAASITESQKEQIISNAAANLSEEQKEQIKSGAVASLTEAQKEEIKNGYIEQMMKSKEVTDKITAAVSSANSAAKSISELKGQLDNYSLFYEGLKEYTSAVSKAQSGADTLKVSMQKLYDNVGLLKDSENKLNDGVKTLLDGTKTLKDATFEFVNETSNMDTVVSDEIDTMVSSVTGDDVKLTSFVSQKNTNIKAVQFVIQTDAIEIPETSDNEPIIEEHLNFWQKLLRLFGLY